jgi:hypothetical protein
LASLYLGGVCLPAIGFGCIATACQKARGGLQHKTSGASLKAGLGLLKKIFSIIALVKRITHAILGQKGGFISDDHFFGSARVLSTALSSKRLKFVTVPR